MDPESARLVLRVIAALFAVGLGVLLARRLRHDLAEAVVGLQLFAIPLLGVALFVLNPIVPAEPPWIIWVLIAALMVVVVLLIWWRRHARQLGMAFKTPAVFALQARVGVVLMACFVLMLSTYLYLFEPVFAVVNVGAYLLWALVWIPKNLRTHRAEDSIAVPASATRVWEFLVDPSNWPQFQVGLKDVELAPPGPLRVGTRVISRRSVPLIGSRAEVPDVDMQFESLVTDINPPISYTVVALDRAAGTKTEVAAASPGAVVTLRSQFAFSIAEGIGGQAFRWPAARARAKAVATESLERLREILSTPEPSA